MLKSRYNNYVTAFITMNGYLFKILHRKVILEISISGTNRHIRCCNQLFKDNLR